MATVAVITRTKDRPNFLERAVHSVADQSYQDYVHVVVNDGGDQKAVTALIDSLDDQLKLKIKLFHRPESSGAPDTILSESVDRVESEYVAIHDDDDTWHPSMLSLSIDILKTGASGVSVRVDNVHETVNRDGFTTTKTKPYMGDLRAISLYRQCIDNQLPTIGFIFKRNAYERVGKYDNSLPVVADWEFGVRFLAEYEVAYLDPGYALAYYHHRKAADNSFAKHSDRKYLTRVMNHYLRREISEGKLGVGYIMSSLRYEQDMLTQVAKRILPSSIARIVQKKVR